MSTTEILAKAKAMTPGKRVALAGKILALNNPPKPKAKAKKPDWNEHREWLKKMWGGKSAPGISGAQLIRELRD